jgi:D-alanyl-D-alanine-carboxypeptidase/D-alanyl-D-alanine-endopeptidase
MDSSCTRTVTMRPPKLSKSELPPELRELELESAAAADYVGKYRFDFGMLDVTLKIDHLEAQLTGQDSFPIFANAKDRFFYKIVDAQLDFERDAGGKVVAVLCIRMDVICGRSA